jgi:aspartate racemase
MKTLGLVGGTSWVSTVDYYKYLNEEINSRLGGNEFARCIIHSFNYGEIQKLTSKQDWDTLLELVSAASNGLVNAGAEGIVLCANTMHLIADPLQERLKVPIIHIVEATAAEIRKAGLDIVILLGTRFTMEMDFFKERLARHGIRTMIPEAAEREFIHGTIFGELARGECRPETKERYLGVIDALTRKGAQGAILGCTEIPLVLKQSDATVPLFDTTRIHASAAATFALAD